MLTLLALCGSFSPQLPGITNIALYPLSWNEATILEQRFRPGVAPEEAVSVAAAMLHEDYAYVFEANCGLWTALAPNNEWTLQPSLVRFIVRGKEFGDGESQTQGEVQVDFGIDTPFLHEELQLTSEVEARVHANVQMLVDFTNRVEKNSGTNARLLWSESDENFARKLVSRLQKVK